MTEAKHNRPIPKLFSNQPSASAANFLAYWLAIKNFPENMSFSLFLNLKEARHKGANLFFFENNILNCNSNPPSSPPLEIKLLEN